MNANRGTMDNCCTDQTCIKYIISRKTQKIFKLFPFDVRYFFDLLIVYLDLFFV